MKIISFNKNKKAGRWWWCTPFNPSNQEAEEGRLWVPGQPGLLTKFQDIQGYTEKPYLKASKSKIK